MSEAEIVARWCRQELGEVVLRPEFVQGLSKLVGRFGDDRELYAAVGEAVCQAQYWAA